MKIVNMIPMPNRGVTAFWAMLVIVVGMLVTSAVCAQLSPPFIGYLIIDFLIIEFLNYHYLVSTSSDFPSNTSLIISGINEYFLHSTASFDPLIPFFISGCPSVGTDPFFLIS